MVRGLYAIVDATFSRGVSLSVLAHEYAVAGAGIIQLRDKERNASQESRDNFREAAFRIAALRRERPFLFIVNDDPDVALAVGADGVHVGKGDARIEDCRRLLGPGRLVGYSSHSLEEALEASRRGADYVAFGAIFPTALKGPGHPIQGIDKLKNVVKALRVPVVAIGGIGRDNVKEALATGVASVAMISALAGSTTSRDRMEAVRFFSGLFR